MSETKEVAGLVERLNASADRLDEHFQFDGDVKLIEADEMREAAREIERLTAERERQWCLSCGTVTRDGTCDCTKTDNPQAQNLVNYADELSKDVSTLAGQVSTLTRQLEEAREGNNTLTFLLDEALPYLETVTDEGPFDEGWRSQDLQNLIAAIRSLKQGEAK